MKNLDDQFSEILIRADVIKKRKNLQKQIAGFAVAIAAGLVLMIMSVSFIPDIKNTASATVTSNYGSLILSVPYFGYVIIGFLAFVIGVLFTMLCFRLRNLKTLETEESGKNKNK